MASRQQPSSATRPPARLYLVTPALADAEAAAALLGPALGTADVAAVLLRLAAADERTLINRIKEIAPLVQDRGAALLTDGHAGLAARAGADGAHLSGIAAVQEAIRSLKPERIVGAGGLESRHDAMLAAESGADYVMFGDPDASGKRPAFAAIRERVEWWTEVFEIPCVAYAESLAEIGELAAAEFVALAPAILADPRGPAAAVADAASRLHGGVHRMRDRELAQVAVPLMLAALLAVAPARAQGPMPITPGAPATKPTSPPPHPAGPKRVKPSTVRPAAAPPPTPEAAAPSPGRDPDLAYGAYQRGYYLTAFQEATKRVNEKSDSKAMTLLAELYANGLGVPNSDDEAAKWYKLAADRGDREAMFALAMFRLGGRGGARDPAEATRLLAAAAKLGQPAAAYNLGLLYLEGRQFPQDFKRAGEFFAVAAQAGTPEAQYALATLYKDGRGVPQDPAQATRLMGEAAKADFLDAELEYAIALFNGTGVGKDETRAAALFRKAAMQGSPIAQNRLARIYAFGRGVPKPDPVQAIRWHLVSKAGGGSDLYLDDYAQKQPPDVRAAAEQAARPWLDVLAASRPQP